MPDRTALSSDFQAIIDHHQALLASGAAPTEIQKRLLRRCSSEVGWDWDDPIFPTRGEALRVWASAARDRRLADYFRSLVQGDTPG